MQAHNETLRPLVCQSRIRTSWKHATSALHSDRRFIRTTSPPKTTLLSIGWGALVQSLSARPTHRNSGLGRKHSTRSSQRPTILRHEDLWRILRRCGRRVSRRFDSDCQWLRCRGGATPSRRVLQRGGFRPSIGRVPDPKASFAWSTLSTKGCLGRSVADLAFVLSRIAGQIPAPLSPSTKLESVSRVRLTVASKACAWRGLRS